LRNHIERVEVEEEEEETDDDDDDDDDTWLYALAHELGLLRGESAPTAELRLPLAGRLVREE
jgi:hypothetical protein